MKIRVEKVKGYRPYLEGKEGKEYLFGEKIFGNYKEIAEAFKALLNNKDTKIIKGFKNF